MSNPKTEYKQFKGTPSAYTCLHAWVRKNKVKPPVCSYCKTDRYKLEWSNISGEYRKDVSDWECLCASCHRRKDKAGNIDFCKYGHERTANNTYIRPDGRTACKECHKMNNRTYRKVRKAEV